MCIIILTFAAFISSSAKHSAMLFRFLNADSRAPERMIYIPQPNSYTMEPCIGP